MSVFGDFQQVWSQRFPQSTLPAAWEEDVRANLAKHKQKVSLLKEELEKEEFYVEYLERLLHDVEEHKKKVAQEKGSTEEIKLENYDVISDNVSKSEVAEPPVIKSAEYHANNTVNKCVSELRESIGEYRLSTISNDLSHTDDETVTSNPDPSSFVTVIEVNGLKPADTGPPPLKLPPKPPVKPLLRSFSRPKTSPQSSNESLVSSSEQLTSVDEPYYDSVAADVGDEQSEQESSTENVFTTQTTLPLPAKRNTFSDVVSEPQSPGTTSNYVNIEYFIKKRSGPDGHSSSEEDEVPELRRSTDDGSYASSSSLESTTPSTRRKFSQDGDSKVEAERMTMYRCILSNIIDSEANYVEWLNVTMQYMKAIKATFSTSHPVITETEFKTIFYKIPELHSLHSSFLENLKGQANKWDSRIGEIFKNMATNLILYGAFLGNYGRSLDTVRKCSASNSQFGEITKHITCKSLSGQSISLEDLLHKPVARVQKNALVLHDLLKYTLPSHPDHNSLSEALKITQGFLDQFNMIQTKSMFPATDRAQRRLVKNSFIVELVDGHRKLRHLFLFNDVIACAKYMSSGRNEKYTYELKWFIAVEDIHILEESTANPHEVSSLNIVSLKSQASNVRDQLRQEEKANEDKKIRLGRGSEKFRKRLLELESQLVLVSPNLVFRIKHRQTQKTLIFFLSSEFERTQWIEAIQTLQKTGSPPATCNISMLELQKWITACRAYLKTNMGSYLLRSGHDESLLVGDLHITMVDLQGLEFNADVYICIEVDFYGHFFRKAKTKMVCNSNAPVWNESFVIDLEGCENLRILVYRETGTQVATLFGKYVQKLSRNWLGQNLVEHTYPINGCQLRVRLKFAPCEVSLRRVPTGKAGALFGEKIQNVCKRQKRDIPFIVAACIREVERRGMSEVGIYRVSGSASDLTRLKKSFESNSYEAEQLLKEVDVHSVTGILKLYLRELPEALFTDHLYPTLLEAFNQSNGNLIRRMELLKDCFSKLPQQNKATIENILEHLIKINQHENENKMSLHNLATVFGPTLLRPGGKLDNNKHRDLLATGTVDVMAQAGILYCYLQDISSAHKHC